MFSKIEPRMVAAPGRDAVQVNGTQPRKVAYIGGTSFTGSTLMSFLLNAQPYVVSIGEVAWSIPKVNPGGYPCSCGATLDTCQFWLGVNREMERRGYLFDADHWNTSFYFTNDLISLIAVRSLGNNAADQIRDTLIHRVPRLGSHLAQVGKRNAALIDSIATIRGAAVFVDASKDHNRLRLLREYCDLELYVIHLVRDAPAFVNSCIRKKKRPIPFQSALRWWNRSACIMERLRRTMPRERWLLVRLEDLCANPGAEIKRVLKFLGVWTGPPVLEFRSAPHHIIGNEMRLGTSSEIRLNTSWRRDLSKAQLDDILRRTIKYRELLGYTGREARP